MDLRNRRLILGGLFFAVMLFYALSYAYVILFCEGSYMGWNGYSNDRRHFYTTSVDPNGSAVMLQPGDELIAINGISPAEDLSVVNWSDSVPPDTPFTISVIRNGQVLNFFSRTVPYPPGESPVSASDKMMSLVYLLFVLTGLFVLLLKPEDRHAWLLALMLGTFIGLPNTTGFTAASLGYYPGIFLSLARFFAGWFFPLFLIFFLNFPQRPKWADKVKFLECWLFLPFLLIVLPAFLAEGRLPAFLAPYLFKIPGIDWLLQRIGPQVMYTIAGYTIGGLVFLVANYYAASAENRKRLRVALIGSGAGFFSLLLLVIDSTINLKQYKTWRYVSDWLQTYLPLTLALVPLSFAYAIVRHKVIPISFILRRGLRYLLVRRGAMILIILIIWFVVTQLLTSLFDRWRPSGLTIGWVSAAVGIAAFRLSQILNNRFFAPVIDRKFFRQSYDAQQIMAELSESVRTVTSQPQLLELVATRIQSALQTHSVTIFLRDATTCGFTSAHRCEYDVFTKDVFTNPKPLTLPDNAPLFKQAADNGTVLDIEESVSASADDAEQDYLTEIESSTYDSHQPHSPHEFNQPYQSPAQQELQTLRNLKGALLFPLKAKDDLQGFIIVGSRLGDLPFTAEDKRLLANVGAPTSFALENARLIEQRIEDARRREELEAQNESRRRELEEARQLQLSMLPKQVPQLPHLEIAAYMKTATEVGGDYYDFALAKDGTLTVAIGDATGHGLKAGTVVTATKGLFNAHAHDPSLAEIFSLISRALKDMNMRSMFMALSLVRISGETLRITSAGMCPLYLYRKATAQVEEHLQKAVPLGSIKQYPYTEFKLEFRSGDLLLLMSDGLPERFNKGREMLGYDPIKRVLAETGSGVSPQALIEKLIAIGDEWAAGSPQDDDITLLVLKAI